MIESIHRPDTTDILDNVRLDGSQPKPPVLMPISTLCQALAQEEIVYCHWKSNNALNRSASGDNDLDLLVSRGDMLRFTEIVSRLGFKPAQASAAKQMPGVLDYFGYDPATDTWIHLHAHYQLVLGHDMSKNYRLPIERAYLESAVQGDLFRTPAVEFEFIVFVLRMILKHSTWDAILGREGFLKAAEQRELIYLQARVNQERVEVLLRRYLPYIGVELFHNCLQALHPSSFFWMRVKTGEQLQASLRANARRSGLLDLYTKLWRRGMLALRRRLFRAVPKYRLAAGGAMLAIVGGDGAGKTTAVDSLDKWLSNHFETMKVHMGKPTWSWTTRTIRTILKLGNVLGLYPVEASLEETLTQHSPVSPGYPWLLREVCRARDRYWTYVKARRFASTGGLVILDRFPHAQIRLMDGPQADRCIDQFAESHQFMSPRRANLFVQELIKREASYYQQIVSPDVLIVLRVDPEIAVQRKTEEDAATVRQRSTEIWNLRWDQTDAHVIDASKSEPDVLAEIKALVWSAL